MNVNMHLVFTFGQHIIITAMLSCKDKTSRKCNSINKTTHSIFTLYYIRSILYTHKAFTHKNISQRYIHTECVDNWVFWYRKFCNNWQVIVLYVTTIASIHTPTVHGEHTVYCMMVFDMSAQSSEHGINSLASKPNDI